MTGTAPLFRMYPRGFLGGFPPPSIERTQPVIDRPLFDHQYRLNILRPADTTTVPHPIVESLYSKYINHALETETFEFRKQVLQTALAAFGTDRFDRWYIQQLYSPAFGDMHSRFLDDTFNFICGKRREMSTMTWSRLIEMGANDGLNAKASDIATQFFDLNHLTGNDQVTCVPANVHLVDALQAWLSNPGGFEDLLMTLNILFGSY